MDFSAFGWANALFLSSANKYFTLETLARCVIVHIDRTANCLLYLLAFSTPFSSGEKPSLYLLFPSLSGGKVDTMVFRRFCRSGFYIWMGYDSPKLDRLINKYLRQNGFNLTVYWVCLSVCSLRIRYLLHISWMLIKGTSTGLCRWKINIINKKLKYSYFNL